MSHEAFILAFQNDPGARTLRVFPRGLSSTEHYEIATPENGAIGTGSGQTLMDEGLVLTGSEKLATHLLTLRVKTTR